ELFLNPVHLLGSRTHAVTRNSDDKRRGIRPNGREGSDPAALAESPDADPVWIYLLSPREYVDAGNRVTRKVVETCHGPVTVGPTDAALVIGETRDPPGRK